jgi:hypothetical protein
LRYGGPTQNTAATRMYWNDEIRNSDVFSYDSMSSCSGSIVGAVYLLGVSVSRSVFAGTRENSPRLRADKEKDEELERRRDGDLTDERRQDLFRDQVCRRSLRVDPRVRFRPAHCRVCSVVSSAWSYDKRSTHSSRQSEGSGTSRCRGTAGQCFVSWVPPACLPAWTHLEISESARDRVQQRDGRELDQRVQRPAR